MHWVVSVANVSRLMAGIDQFGQLKVLSLAGNCIADINELRHLQPCRQLEVLNIQENPVSNLPYFRSHVVYMLPRECHTARSPYSYCMLHLPYTMFASGIRSLDNRSVAALERERAAAIVAREASTLQVM